MKVTNIVVSVLAAGLLLISWITFVSNSATKNAVYYELKSEAEESVKNGLYEQGIEYYTKMLEYDTSREMYGTIKGTYDLLYEEEPDSYVRSIYKEFLEKATSAYPQDEEFWNAQINLCLDEGSESKAFKAVKSAKNHGAKGDKIDALYDELYYMIKVDYKSYIEYKTGNNGYITVYDGRERLVIDSSGESLSGNYDVIGIINDEGQGFFVRDNDVRLFDENLITRNRYDVEIEDAGCYDEESGIVPVKIGEKWKYLKSDGTFLSGEYDTAGAFCNGRAVAENDGKWCLVKENGTVETLTGIENIKLDGYGFFNRDGVVLAKKNGKYGFYDDSFEKLNDFEADDVDVYTDGSPIAFAKNGKWGFADTEGDVVIEPQYEKAKSFSNGFAAVCGSDGRWGFIKKSNDLVIGYQFFDAFYFTENETCLVSESEGAVQMLHFKFD